MNRLELTDLSERRPPATSCASWLTWTRVERLNVFRSLPNLNCLLRGRNLSYHRARRQFVDNLVLIRDRSPQRVASCHQNGPADNKRIEKGAQASAIGWAATVAMFAI